MVVSNKIIIYTSNNILIYLNCAAILVHLLSGIFGIYNIQDGNPKVDVTAPLFDFITDPLPGEPFLKTIPKVIFTVGILTPLVAVEFITAAFHMIYLASLYYPNVEKFIRGYIINSPSKNPLRWIEYGITATLMASFGNVAIGITDFYMFVRTISCGITLQGLGYLIECVGEEYRKSDNEQKKIFLKLYRGLYYFQGLLNNLPFVGILLYQTFASSTHGAFKLFIENSFPLAFWYNTFGLVCQAEFNGWKPFASKEFSEKYYILLSVSTKMAIFWTEFATFKKIIEDNGFIESSGLNWDAVRYCALSIPFSVVAAFAFYDYRSWKFNHLYQSLNTN